MQTIASLRRGRETNSQRSGRENRRLSSAGTRQVVFLVENKQAETLADVSHVNVSTIVGGYADGSGGILVVANNACVVAQASKNPPVPLVHQVSHRRDDERRCWRLDHCHQGHFCLAGACGHNYLSAPASLKVPLSK